MSSVLGGRLGLVAILTIASFTGLAELSVAAPTDRFSRPFQAPVSPVRSIADLLREAEAGDAQAQFEIGLAYQLGLGVGRDVVKARQWYERAAERDHPRGLLGLGFLLLQGQGGPQDFVRAEQVLQRAADKGEATALANLAEVSLELRPDQPQQAIALLEQAVAAGAMNARYRLGRFLMEGVLAPADSARGLRLLRDAASNGVPYAQAYLAYIFSLETASADERREGLKMAELAAEAGLAEGLNELGRYHAFGIGIPRDPHRGAQLFAQAGSLGDPNGWYNLALLHGDGALGSANEAEARRLALLAAQTGHTLASAMAGRMLFRGEGGPADPRAALPFLQRAAEAGDNSSRNYLALILFNGSGGVQPDTSAAMDLWEKAALEGHGPSTNNFTMYLAEGRGRPADPARAAKLLAAQAEQGYAPAQFRWALWLEQGWAGIPQNLSAALTWFRRAAENGHAAAAFKYASYVEAGEGIPADQAEAFRWYKVGAERGNPAAQFQVARIMFSGDGVPADQAAGLLWLERSARQGYAEALYVLGDLTFRGEGRPADPLAAWAYFRLAEGFGLREAAANRRHVEAQLLPIERSQAVNIAEQIAETIRKEKDDE